MKRRILLIVLALAVCLCISTVAAADAPLIVDDSGLLTDHTISVLEQEYADIRDMYGFTPYLVTVDSFEGLPASEFAKMLYDDILQCKYDGILLLVSLEEGEWNIYRKGICDQTLTGDDVDEIGEEVVRYLREGDFYGAFHAYGEETVRQMTNTSDEGGDGIDTAEIIISAVIGLVLAFIAMLFMKAGMKTVRANDSASYYVRSGSMHVTYSRDIYLFSTVTRTRIQRNNTGNGSGSGGRI